LGTEEETAGNAITIYPLPAQDEVHVVMNHLPGTPPKRIQEIRLLNLNSKEVTISPIWHGNEFSFSCTHLPAGMYVLSLVLEEKTFTRKIVIGAY
jgi:hypothetical protein